ncbi:MAG TPA: SPOR domain-containing protein [Burkholderiaceae bacterium]|nr:SPOR domain-containing protein [Burkholderiaceae bacterium]
MARKTRKSGKSRGMSGTMMGLVAGLMLGVGAAVAVAFFVLEVPMPFVDKASRAPATTLLPGVRNAPDPNIGLYGPDGPAGTVPAGQGVTVVTPLPGTGSAANGQASSNALANQGTAAGQNAPVEQNTPHKAKSPRSPDALGSLIASLGKTPVPGTQAEPKTAPHRARTEPAQGTQTVYYLQAGAFHSSKDADAMKARILMLGLSAQVEDASVNGATLHRVRVGPFKGIDAMNRARAKLGDDKIASSVVRH